MKFFFSDIERLLKEKDIIDFNYEKNGVTLRFSDDTSLSLVNDKAIYKYDIVTDIVTINKSEMSQITEIVEVLERSRFKKLVTQVVKEGSVNFDGEKVIFSLGDRTVVLTKESVSGYIKGKLALQSDSEPESYKKIVESIHSWNERK